MRSNVKFQILFLILVSGLEFLGQVNNAKEMYRMPFSLDVPKDYFCSAELDDNEFSLLLEDGLGYEFYLNTINCTYFSKGGLNGNSEWKQEFFEGYFRDRSEADCEKQLITYHKNIKGVEYYRIDDACPSDRSKYTMVVVEGERNFACIFFSFYDNPIPDFDKHLKEVMNGFEWKSYQNFHEKLALELRRKKVYEDDRIPFFESDFPIYFTYGNDEVWEQESVSKEGGALFYRNKKDGGTMEVQFVTVEKDVSDNELQERKTEGLKNSGYFDNVVLKYSYPLKSNYNGYSETRYSYEAELKDGLPIAMIGHFFRVNDLAIFFEFSNEKSKSKDHHFISNSFDSYGAIYYDSSRNFTMIWPEGWYRTYAVNTYEYSFVRDSSNSQSKDLIYTKLPGDEDKIREKIKQQEESLKENSSDADGSFDFLEYQVNGKPLFLVEMKLSNNYGSSSINAAYFKWEGKWLEIAMQHNSTEVPGKQILFEKIVWQMFFQSLSQS